MKNEKQPLTEIERTISQLQALTAEAVETLKRNLYCENPAVEIRTAQIIIDGAINGLSKLKELKRTENENQWFI